jgi:CelD/BcsL family acetyltransferase involved in cellulose biosynthesis
VTATTILSSQARRGAANADPVPRRSALTLDIVRDEAGFKALQPFWDVLVEKMETRSPFVRWDWMCLWWEECRKEARLVIGVLRDEEGVPQAIAPLMLASEPDSVRKHLVTLTFLAGFGEAHGERLDLIVPAGREDELTPQLCRVFKVLQPECDNVRLNHLPEESPNRPHLLNVLREAFSHAGVLNRLVCRFIHLPASWEDYEARHSSKWRNLLRRVRRAFTAEHAGIATQAGERMTIAETMKEFRVLHAMQWADGISSFTTQASWRFHQRLAARWLPQQRAWMPLLEADGKLVAALYGFVEREQFFQYQTGWDWSLAKISPGRLVTRWAIDGCIQRGLQVYDMLPCDYEYKRQWCDGARLLLDLEAFNPASWRAIAFHALRTVRRWLPRTTSQVVISSNDSQEGNAPVLRPAA